ILAANSWMQHPVGVALVDGKPVLTSIWAVLTNNTALAAIPHTIAGAFAVAAAVLVGVGAWQLARSRDREVWRATTRLGGVVGLAAFVVLAVTGDIQGKLMFEQQPMKMAAAEALCHTEQPAGFSVFAVGDVAGQDCASVKSITVPALLSFLAEGDFDARVDGVDDLVTQYQRRYGTTYPDDPALGEFAGQPIDYVPDLRVTYWSFRLMIGFGVLAAAVAAWALWATRRGRSDLGSWPARIALWSIAAPVAANSFGWIFTEMGRQPFVVAPNPGGVDGVWMLTAQGVSGMTVAEIATSLVVLTVVYGLLAVIEFVLLRRVVLAGAPKIPETGTRDRDASVLDFAY
ncbi:cytochrome ubiquinol oxidase subunit I, partial [Actinokineospora guangxiensis]